MCPFLPFKKKKTISPYCHTSSWPFVCENCGVGIAWSHRNGYANIVMRKNSVSKKSDSCKCCISVCPIHMWVGWASSGDLVVLISWHDPYGVTCSELRVDWNNWDGGVNLLLFHRPSKAALSGLPGCYPCETRTPSLVFRCDETTSKHTWRRSEIGWGSRTEVPLHYHSLTLPIWRFMLMDGDI